MCVVLVKTAYTGAARLCRSSLLIYAGDTVDMVTLRDLRDGVGNLARVAPHEAARGPHPGVARIIYTSRYATGSCKRRQSTTKHWACDQDAMPWVWVYHEVVHAPRRHPSQPAPTSPALHLHFTSTSRAHVAHCSGGLTRNVLSARCRRPRQEYMMHPVVHG
ncbi:hypothetical protein T440DRAFT_38023 [Plenodomus tracheiphilus IPT5]|uniref:Uncharacterized protein n=1 Tax=Plenodomus tracheiphilus IPT5 TaxID=1408161 RepID=A0A6A7BAH2_9PLEO|nr:hypothetical protein T440DRAFT_38023 [Plenodomus tracheiphilus IPT5]